MAAHDVTRSWTSVSRRRYLIQEGNIGLMRAVQRFDPNRSVRLVTYAEPWIRSCTRNDIVRNWSLASDVERVAARLSVKASEVREMRLRLQGRDLSLDAPATAERRDAPIDSLASAVPSQDEALWSAEESRRLAGQVGEALARLDPRERLVLELQLLGDPPIALTEIGRRLGVSRERARQLEVRARRKLQAELGGLGPGGAPLLSSPLAPGAGAPAPARSPSPDCSSSSR